MTETADALDIIRGLVERINTGDRDGFQGQLAEDVIHIDSAKDETIQGPKAVTDNVWSLRTTIPDLRVEVVDAFACGNRAAAELEWTGTYEPYTYGASAPKMSWRGCTIVTIEAGRIARVSLYQDWLGVLDQLESIPSGPERPQRRFLQQRLAKDMSAKT